MNAINKITEEDVEQFSSAIEAPTGYGGNVATLYQRISTKSALYPGQGTFLGLGYCAGKLNGEAGELGEHVFKAWRDDGVWRIKSRAGYGEGLKLEILTQPLTPERREFIIKEIGDCLWYLSALCNELGITLAYAMLSNLRKLASRTARQTLRGSGDER